MRLRRTTEKDWLMRKRIAVLAAVLVGVTGFGSVHVSSGTAASQSATKSCSASYLLTHLFGAINAFALASSARSVPASTCGTGSTALRPATCVGANEEGRGRHCGYTF
jgi:hypothetical protein